MIGLLTAAGLLLCVARPAAAADIDWPTWGYDGSRTGTNPDETQLTAANVSELHLEWSIKFRVPTDSTPVLAADVSVQGTPTDLLYVGNRNGDFFAIDAADGHKVWKKNLGTLVTSCFGQLGVTSAAAIDRSTGRVLVAGADGLVHSLDLATGHEAHGWPVTYRDLPNEYVYGALNIRDGSVYVPIAAGCDRDGESYGRVTRISIARHKITSIWYGTGPTTGISGAGVWGWGGAAIDPADGDVYVTTANSEDPSGNERAFFAESIVRLDPALGLVSSDQPTLSPAFNDADFGSTPILYTPQGCAPQLATENKNGELFTYARDAISSGPLSAFQVSAPIFVGVPMFSPATNMLYVGISNDAPSTYTHGLAAFTIGDDCLPHLAWQKVVGPGGRRTGPPVYANGVVYFPDGPGMKLDAFDAITGDPLWDSGTVIKGNTDKEPVVVNGHVYLTNVTGLYAFGR